VRVCAQPGELVVRPVQCLVQLANAYGMMGDTRAGHTFILVDADGEIAWRADYGGAPDYTTYLPVDRILADLEAARDDA
jgi:peroxiredoxin Q/BCP